MNLVAKPGFTDFAIFVYDQNGLLDYVCEKLHDRQVEYIDLATWGWISPNFNGSMVVSATYWEHEVFDPEGKIVRNTVTDPYSVALSMNSKRSQILDLRGEDARPAGWEALKKPALASLNDSVIYELHIRDFSSIDASVPAAQRGTYLAFTNPASNGMKHLKALADAGLTHVHPQRRPAAADPAADGGGGGQAGGLQRHRRRRGGEHHPRLVRGPGPEPGA